VLLTTVALAINGISMMFLSAFQAHRKMVTVSIANIANDAIISAAIILMIPGFPSVVTALSLTVLVSAINLGVLIRIYLGTVGPLQFMVDMSVWRALLKEGTPIAVSSLAISMYTFIGPTILKYTRGETEVGLFSAGYKLISILTLIPATFSQVVFPIFSDFYKNANHKLDKALQDSLRMMSEISIPLAVGGIILAPRIFSLLYPASFTDGALVFQVIIAGNAVGYLAQVLYAFLLATDRHRVCMWDTIAVAILVTAAGLTLIPRHGYQSVAIILMVTDVVLFTSLLLLTIRPGRFSAKIPKMLRILGSSALMGGFLFLIRDWYLMPVIIVAGVLYLLALFLLRSFGDQESEILSKIKRELLNA
jgi:O-antigen/teichoic acid export membrane protein